MNDARVALRSDKERLLELFEACVRETPTDRAGHLFGFPRRHEAISDRLEASYESLSRAVFAGLVDNHVVGFAIVSTTEAMPGGRLATVEELYVQPEAREVGVGESLLDSCVEWARSHDCSGIEVEARPGARSAKNLAERSGFTARMLVLHRRLS